MLSETESAVNSFFGSYLIYFPLPSVSGPVIEITIDASFSQSSALLSLLVSPATSKQ